MKDPIPTWIQQRREALAAQAGPESASQRASAQQAAPQTWGLALSGGGIRSATFGFGLLVALARQQLLLKFDFLSTVSGGGFIGALVGRLFDRNGAGQGGARQVERALADADGRWFCWWLRANGNYLFARGARDIFVAAATMLRNLIALHIELALLAILLGTLLAGFDLLMWATLDQLWAPDPQQASQALQRAIRRIAHWLPSLWLLLLPLLALAGVLVCAYWALPPRWTRQQGVGAVVHWAAWLGVAAWLVGWQAWFVGVIGLSNTAWLALLGMAALWVLGIPVGWLLALHHRAGRPMPDHDAVLEDSRVALTLALGVATQAGCLVLGAGLLDRLAWWLGFQVQADVQVGAALLGLAALLRAVLGKLGSSSGAAPSWLGSRLLLIAHLTGLVVTAALAAWWMSLLYRQVHGAVFVPGADEMQFGAGVVRLLFYLLAVTLFLFLSGRDVEFVNLSSLHRFYRARLVRGWLGATNPARFRGASSALDLRPTHAPEDQVMRDVAEVAEGDDQALSGYAPQAQGGPVHLINVCLNQTTRRGAGPFNRDRKGLPLTVAGGNWMRVSDRPWCQVAGDALPSLGGWTAISGAAFSPGLGMMTRSGISALAMFAGVRLGYWWDAKAMQAKPEGERWFAKSRLLLQELMGRFEGDSGRYWYLSDGGHFDNTGAYALLRERTRLIVLADCGADPEYRFGDLENLVRRARVDLGAEIRFLRPDDTAAGATYRDFGSLGDLASPRSNACLALADVTYADGSKARLLLVKPNLFSGLPVDLVNFKAANPDFPQQSTSDQSFDEAQWESHFLLGRHIGKRLDPQVLQRLADAPKLPFIDDDGHLPGPAAADGQPTPGLRTRITATAVGASIGLGTVATLGISLWQGIDGWRSASAKAAEADDKALKELTDLWGKLKPAAAVSAAAPDPAAAGALAAALLRIGDTLCPNGFDRWFKTQDTGPTAKAVLDDTRNACVDLKHFGPTHVPVACTRLLALADRNHCLYPQDAVTQRDDPAYRSCPPRYWGRDYTLWPIDVVGNCPRVAAQSEWPAGAAITGAAAPPAASAAAERPAVAPATGSASATALADGGGPASRPTTRPAVPGADGLHRPLAACTGKRIYVQVYGLSRQADAMALRTALAGDGATVPAAEDVVARAALNRNATPTPVRADIVRWHTDADLACGEVLRGWLNSTLEGHWNGSLGASVAEPLAPHLPATPGVVEVWLTPAGKR